MTSTKLIAPKTYDELVKCLEHDDKVKVAGIDVDGVLRGKLMSKDKFLSTAKGDGFGFASVVFGWDLHDVNYSPELLISTYENGYRDLLAEIDLSSYRRIPWEFNVPFFLVKFVIPETSEPLSVDPRTLLGRFSKEAAELGWQCIAGAELEYFQFSETPQSLVEKNFSKLKALTPGMHGYSVLRPTLNKHYFYGLYDQATKFGIEVEGHHTETGPGVYETALAYTNAERMADNICLFKLAAKSVGMEHGVMPTFMAKPYTELPGCSGHIHVSLRDTNGRNIFAASDAEIKAGGRKGAAHDQLKFISQEAEWFLAGLIEGMPDFLPMFCPTTNSYKRLLGGAAFWAPDASTYGYDSRTASVRIISPPGCPPAGTRFEFRVPGADMNTHYALSAIFAMGLHGIKKKMSLPYGPIGAAGVTMDTVKRLDTSLEDSVRTFKRKDSMARELLGDLFVDHFAGTRENEVMLQKRNVTSWEVERYFELV